MSYRKYLTGPKFESLDPFEKERRRHQYWAVRRYYRNKARDHILGSIIDDVLPSREETEHVEYQANVLRDRLASEAIDYEAVNTPELYPLEETEFYHPSAIASAAWSATKAASLYALYTAAGLGYLYFLGHPLTY